ncbi:MAG TPA: delta-60 repeat domain-containing protein, partial [Myxococcota bacterium]|nr:delta-60 repeat domain-containing protein [Myxococcota bacterium]
MSALRSSSSLVTVALLCACGLERVSPEATALVDTRVGGQLDTGFGSEGRILEALGTTRDDAWDTALLPDGGVVLAGNSFASSSIDVGIMKLTPNGGDDPGFGTSLTGTVTVPSAGDENTCGVSVIGDKIITAGSRGTFPYFSSVYVARFHFNGALDAGFGGGGVFLGNVSADIVTTGAHAIGQEFVCQTFADGNGLKVAGHARFDDAGGRDVITMRLVDGFLDTTYGDQGVARVDLGGDDRLWRGSYQDTSGRIPMCVVQGDPDGPRRIVVARVSADGTLDTSFAGTGSVTFPDAKPNYECHGIVVDDAGRVLVAGFEPGGSGDMFLRRFSDDGVLDTAFGDNGLLLIDVAGG